jgi:hypothetical protein
MFNLIKIIKKNLYDQYKILDYTLNPTYINKSVALKSKFRIYSELINWYYKYGERNKMYFAWGLHEKGKLLSDYISRKEFLKIKSKAERHLLKTNNISLLNYDVITKDKFVANSFLSANNIPCIPHYGIVIRGQFYPTDNSDIDNLDLLLDKEKGIVFKNITLEFSEGFIIYQKKDDVIFMNSKENSLSELKKILGSGVWLVQKKISSHKALRMINNSALNTTRIVTIRDKKGPVYLTGFQAFARGAAVTDSGSDGSIYVGVDIEKECLKEYGLYNTGDPVCTFLIKHPDSDIIFKDYKIPFLKEAIQLCIKAHNLLYNNFIIGWDVAITDDGPFIVEANEKPGLNAVQSLDGGCRKKILNCYRNIVSKGENLP